MRGITIGDTLRLSARRFGEKTALIFGGVHVSFRELDEHADQLANGLLKLGVQKGERVALLSRNCPQYVEAYFAVARTGAVFVPLNYSFAPPEMRWCLEDCGPRILIVSDEYVPMIEQMRPTLPRIETYVHIGTATPQWALSWDELLARSPATDPGIEIDEHDEYCMIYTSGTSGRSKGVMATHRARVLYGHVAAVQYWGGDSDLINLIATPLFHVGTLQLKIQSCVMLGATSVLHAKFDVEAALEAIERYKVTHISMVPTMFHTLLNFPSFDRYDVRSLRRCMYGASLMPPTLLKEARAHMPGVRFCQNYGSTEAGVVTVLSPEDMLRRPDSAGKPAMLVGVKTVGPDGRELPIGQVGELAVWSAQLMTRYWNRPELTREVLRDGWYYTGDLACVDGEGFVSIVGRKDDLIISGGENIAPKEVEDVLLAHPSVAEASVFGVPHERWVETPWAAVVLRPGAEGDATELIEYCKRNLAGYKKPTRIVFVEALPKKASGKVDRDTTRRLCQERAERGR